MISQKKIHCYRDHLIFLFTIEETKYSFIMLRSHYIIMSSLFSGMKRILTNYFRFSNGSTAYKIQNIFNYRQSVNEIFRFEIYAECNFNIAYRTAKRMMFQLCYPLLHKSGISRRRDGLTVIKNSFIKYSIYGFCNIILGRHLKIKRR